MGARVIFYLHFACIPVKVIATVVEYVQSSGCFKLIKENVEITGLCIYNLSDLVVLKLTLDVRAFTLFLFLLFDIEEMEG